MIHMAATNLGRVAKPLARLHHRLHQDIASPPLTRLSSLPDGLELTSNTPERLARNAAGAGDGFQGLAAVDIGCAMVSKMRRRAEWTVARSFVSPNTLQKRQW